MSDFTHPGPLDNQQRPVGTGDHGETWDPETKRWIPQSEMPATPGGAGGIAPQAPQRQSMTDAQGNPVTSNTEFDPSTGGTSSYGQAPTVGRVHDSGAASGKNLGDAWGGYSGTNIQNPDGSISYDAGRSGRADDVARFSGLGAAAANRQAYQNDYGQANQDAAMAQGARNEQSNAIGLSRDMAANGSAQSQALGQRMIQNGLQNQQAAAMSTRGGSLAQAAARQQQQEGAGAFTQAGNNALAAQRADDMATGRNLYMSEATAQRAGDATAQGLDQSQAINQMNNELGQRDLNQQGQMGYEGMSQNVNKAAQDAALRQQETNQGLDAASTLRNTARADREVKMGSAIAAGAGSLLAKGSEALSSNSDSNNGSSDPWDPKNYSGSDARMKTGARSLASAVMARKGMR